LLTSLSFAGTAEQQAALMSAIEEIQAQAHTNAAAAVASSPEVWAERDPRMLDCILVRHGESEGNIGQPFGAKASETHLTEHVAVTPC
jgi:hypothetical protein